jgi:hypothetical protein
MTTTSPLNGIGQPAARPAYKVRTPNARAKMTNGTRGMVLPGIDQRSAIARRFRDVMCAVVADSGGADRLSEARLQLIRRFSALVVQAESMEGAFVDGKPFDFEAHARISSTLVRLAVRIGLKRTAKDITPTLSEILLQAGEEDEREQSKDTAP